MKSFCKLILNENEIKMDSHCESVIVSISAQWFIDILFITRDSRMSNKLCEKSFTVWMIWNSIKAEWLHTVKSFLASVFLPHILSIRTRKSRNDVHFPEYPHDCKQSLALFWSSGSVLSVRPRILSIKFWWFGYPCYDGPIAKAMDYTSKGELLWKNQPNY